VFGCVPQSRAVVAVGRCIQDEGFSNAAARPVIGKLAGDLVIKAFARPVRGGGNDAAPARAPDALDALQ
jgi:hypothetical protein